MIKYSDNTMSTTMKPMKAPKMAMPRVPSGAKPAPVPRGKAARSYKTSKMLFLPLLAGALLLNACASTPKNVNKSLIAAKAAYQTANSLHDELCKTPTPGVSVSTCHKTFVVLKSDYVVIQNSAKLLRQYEVAKDKAVLAQLSADLPQVQATVAELVQLVQDLKNGK